MKTFFAWWSGTLGGLIAGFLTGFVLVLMVQQDKTEDSEVNEE